MKLAQTPSNERSAHSARSGDEFATTHWSVVLAASDSAHPQSQAALEELCRTYWYPLYAFVRRRGQSPEEAEDVTQEFFARLLEKHMLGDLKRDGGKFRSYLLRGLKCFLANEWHREHAQKRGGGKVFVPIDAAAETRYVALRVEATPDLLFEREWTWTVLDRVFTLLREEWAREGKTEMFEWLRGYLPGVHPATPYARIGEALQMNEPAVRMAVHRLRRRYGELLRAEVADTVSSPGQIDEELRSLIAAVSW